MPRPAVGPWLASLSVRTEDRDAAGIPAARTITGVLDHAFEVMRLHAGVVLTVSVVAVLPLSIMMLVLQIQTIGLDGVGDPLAGFDEDGGSNVTLTVAAVLVSSLQVTLMAGALTPLVADDVGPDVSASHLAGRLLRRLPSVLAAWVVVKLMQVVGLLGLMVGAAFVMVFTSLTTPAIMAGSPNPFRAIGTSFRLVSKAFGRAIGTISLMIVVDTAIRLSFVSVPAVITAWTRWTVGEVAAATFAVVADLVSAAFVGAATAPLFVDLRVRADHFDLERRFERAGVPW